MISIIVRVEDASEWDLAVMQWISVCHAWKRLTLDNIWDSRCRNKNFHPTNGNCTSGSIPSVFFRLLFQDSFPVISFLHRQSVLSILQSFLIVKTFLLQDSEDHSSWFPGQWSCFDIQLFQLLRFANQELMQALPIWQIVLYKRYEKTPNYYYKVTLGLQNTIWTLLNIKRFLRVLQFFCLDYISLWSFW